LLVYSYVAFTELEERRVGLILGHRSSFIEEFLIGFHSPYYGCLLPSFIDRLLDNYVELYIVLLMHVYMFVCPILEAPHSRRQPKQTIYIYI
jgi:hypothetical protein